LAAEELKTEPETCLVFVDAQAGIEAALNGGMKCVGVGDPAILQHADMVIRGFEKLNWEKVYNGINID
jgi:beta-phosphoglucomutase